MRAVGLTFVVVVTLVAGAGGAVSAQPPETALSPIEVAVACAPPPSLVVPSTPLHIVGAQDTLPRNLLERRDMLVVSGGLQQGMQLGQKYFIRRPVYSHADAKHVDAILTLGWMTVVSLNDTTALGSLDYFCDGVNAGDYLEAYTRPAVPASVERDEITGEPDFSTLGRVVSGVENHMTTGIGKLVLIDRGADQGVAPGARFAVYRDLHKSGMPLTSVGEAVVLSTGKTMSLTRITRSRDAVVAGDYVVARK
jgi:hypothetical protein